MVITLDFGIKIFSNKNALDPYDGRRGSHIYLKVKIWWSLPWVVILEAIMRIKYFNYMHNYIGDDIILPSTNSNRMLYEQDRISCRPMIFRSFWGMQYVICKDWVKGVYRANTQGIYILTLIAVIWRSDLVSRVNPPRFFYCTVNQNTILAREVKRAIWSGQCI